MNAKDKELWLKYAKQIKLVEAGEAFIVPTKIDPLKDVLFNHCAQPFELWHELMLVLKVPVKTRSAALNHNKRITEDEN